MWRYGYHPAISSVVTADRFCGIHSCFVSHPAVKSVFLQLCRLQSTFVTRMRCLILTSSMLLRAPYGSQHVDADNPAESARTDGDALHRRDTETTRAASFIVGALSPGVAPTHVQPRGVSPTRHALDAAFGAVQSDSNVVDNEITSLATSVDVCSEPPMQTTGEVVPTHGTDDQSTAPPTSTKQQRLKKRLAVRATKASTLRLAEGKSSSGGAHSESIRQPTPSKALSPTSSSTTGSVATDDACQTNPATAASAIASSYLSTIPLPRTHPQRRGGRPANASLAWESAAATGPRFDRLVEEANEGVPRLVKGDNMDTSDPHLGHSLEGNSHTMGRGMRVLSDIDQLSADEYIEVSAADSGSDDDDSVPSASIGVASM